MHSTDDRQSLRVITNGKPHDLKILLPDGTDLAPLVRRLSFELTPEGNFVPEITLSLNPSPVTVDIIGKITAAQVVQYPVSGLTPKDIENWKRADALKDLG